MNCKWGWVNLLLQQCCPTVKWSLGNYLAGRDNVKTSFLLTCLVFTWGLIELQGDDRLYMAIIGSSGSICRYCYPFLKWGCLSDFKEGIKDTFWTVSNLQHAFLSVNYSGINYPFYISSFKTSLFWCVYTVVKEDSNTSLLFILENIIVGFSQNVFVFYFYNFWKPRLF